MHVGESTIWEQASTMVDINMRLGATLYGAYNMQPRILAKIMVFFFFVVCPSPIFTLLLRRYVHVILGLDVYIATHS